MLRVVDSPGRISGTDHNLVSKLDGGLQPQDARSRGFGDGATVPTWGILTARVAVNGIGLYDSKRRAGSIGNEWTNCVQL